ncbi:MAG TPA: LemA family protein [Patescibacteria group bacterium]|nr:LemA family protein [Patescibacteria group bacterium]
MATSLIITLIVIAGLALIAVFIYNSLIVKRNRVDEAWSDINVQLKRRYDLIPNLVDTVKGYAKHEKELFEKVTQARSAAMGAGTMAEKAQAENMLSQTLKSLFAVSENYPDLKASQNFLQLQDELSDTENKIQAARRFYNGNVLEFNNTIQQFPTNVFAGVFNFSKRDFFQLESEAEKQVPKAQF